MRRVLSVLASLKLSIVLLFLLFLLTFLGTLYQVHNGIFKARQVFFYSWIIFEFYVPLPGGQLVLWLTGINLIASIFMRILNKKPFLGLLLTHVGLVLLLIGGFQGLYLSDQYVLGMWEGGISSEVFKPESYTFSYSYEGPERKSEGTINFAALKENHIVHDNILNEVGLNIYINKVMTNSRKTSLEDNRVRLIPQEPEEDSQNNLPGLELLLITTGGQQVPVLLHIQDGLPSVYTFGDATLMLRLGPEVHPLPFQLSLVDFDARFYPGTDVPKSFSSKVKIVDENVDWQRTISMNNPLRYRGYTFYQTSYELGDDGKDASIFSVTTGSFSWIPYSAVILMILGMVLHYVQKKLASRKGVLTIALLLMAPAALFSAEPAADFSDAANAFAELRISISGRVMPVDSFARSSLRTISGRSGLKDFSISEWFFYQLFDPLRVAEVPLYLVEHPDNLAVLGLPFDERGRYSYEQLAPAVPKLMELGSQWQGEPPNDPLFRDLYNLYRKLEFTEALSSIGRDSMSQPPGPDFFRIVPGFEDDQEHWFHLGEEGIGRQVDGHRYSRLFESISRAVQEDDPSAALATVKDISILQQKAVDSFTSPGMPLLEVFYNFVPFLPISVLLLLGGIVSNFFKKSLPVKFLYWYAIGLALLLQTAYLCLRMIIMQRPPITSLYSSMIFVSWAVLVFVVIFGRNDGKNDLVVSGMVLSMVLIIASAGLSRNQDTMAVLQAVLDTNFWLTVHVITIALGYAFNLLAGIVAHLYLFGKLLHPFREDRLHRSIRHVYILLVAGLIFSFAGTMFGGFWADQSWGRFWGWDPKENGALMIILWGAILLHLRPSGFFKDLGFSIGAILGIPVVLFSWFGVNMLGVGLHSYGFSNGSFLALTGFSLLEIVLSFSVWLLIKRCGAILFPGARPFILVRKFPVARDTWSFILQPQLLDESSLEIVRAPAGSFVTLLFELNGKILKRPYSLSDWQPNAKQLRITVKKQGPDSGSEYLVERFGPGMSIQLLGPSGELRLHEDVPGKEVFMASGTGFAPLLGMIKQRLFQQPSTEIWLFLGAKNSESIVHFDELKQLLNNFETFHCCLFLSAVPRKGRINFDDNNSERLKFSQGHFSLTTVLNAVSGCNVFYSCGSDEFVSELESEKEALQSSGELRDPIWKAERFTPMPILKRLPSKAHKVIFTKIRKTISVEAGQSILHAALEHGIDVNYSCGTGQCRECICSIVKGAVLQDEPNLLTGEEILQEKKALACISYPTEDVEIEID